MTVRNGEVAYLIEVPNRASVNARSMLLQPECDLLPNRRGLGMVRYRRDDL